VCLVKGLYICLSIGQTTPTYIPPLLYETRGRTLGRNWEKSLKSFPPCYSQSPILKDFTPPPPLKSENSQDYSQKPQRICMFMNLASGRSATVKTTFKKQPRYSLTASASGVRLIVPESGFSAPFLSI
jgi:hypothetical protein